LVLENEDLWVSANFFYFDNKIVESEQLAIPLKSNEFQVFYTLLHLFHKFPQPIFDKSYTSFAKNFTQNILGNNSTLYNVENKILEPYAKATMRANEYSALDGVKDFFSIFKNPMFIQFELNKLDIAFYRSLFKYLFIIKGGSILGLKKRRKKIFMLRKLLKRRWYKNYKQVENFRIFSGLSPSFEQPIFGRSSLAQQLDKNNLFEKSYNAQNLRFISSQFTPPQRHSRLESRFLKIFWLTFPVYFSMTRNFFFNAFPEHFSIQFFPSKLKVLFNNLIIKIFKSRSNLRVGEFFDSREVTDLFKEVKEASSDEGVSAQFKGIIMSEVIPEDSVIKFFKKDKNTENQKVNQDLEDEKEEVQTAPQVGEGVFSAFDVLIVNRVGVLDDLRRIKSTFAEDKEDKKKASTEDSEQKELEGEDTLKEKIEKFYRNRALLLERKKNRFNFVKNKDLYTLSGIPEGFTKDQFSKKRIRYKRYLKRKGTRLRAYWITKDRFFFSNQYNNLFDIPQRVEFIELYKILEYFYFVLLNDRDLYDMAEYSFIVSTLRERFGISIVNDLLSNVDHKQASKISVVMHVNESFNVGKENNGNNLSVNSETETIIENNLYDKYPQAGNPSLSYSPFIMHEQGVFLTKPMQEYIKQLIIYYNNLAFKVDKKT